MDRVHDILTAEQQQVEGIRTILRGIIMLATNMVEVLDIMDNPTVMNRLAGECQSEFPEVYAANAQTTKAAANTTGKNSNATPVQTVEKAQPNRADNPAQPVADAKPTAAPKATPAAEPPKTMDIDKPEEFFTEILSKDKLTKDDVQRAMGFVLMARGKKGQNPAAIGEALSQFHGARCLSELQEEDFRGYIEAIRKL